jgi:hypothetical protein
MQVMTETMGNRSRPASRHRNWLLLGGAGIAAVVALMFAYLRISGVTMLNSDGAGIILEASNMLHGNLLLHGWVDTDVSFMTTELPEYMGVIAVTGVRPEVVHIAAALTYTLLVVLAAFVARGRARGAEGVAGGLLAAGIMLAPQAGASGETFVLLGSPDHFGTAVPVLLLLLLLDLPRPRWFVPVGAGVLLAWSMVGDQLVEVVGVIPLVLASLLRAGRILAARRAGGAANQEQGEPPTWRAVSYELSMAAAALAAIPASALAYRVIRHFGGYQLGPKLYGKVSWQVVTQNAPFVWRSVLSVFSADYTGAKGAGNVAIALLHLVGVAVVFAAFGFAVWRLVRPARADRLGDLVADMLVIAIAANIAAYFLLVQITNMWGAHEIAPVLPLGAALAGRMLGGPLLRTRLPRTWLPGTRGQGTSRWGTRGWGVPALAAFLAANVVLLAIAAAAPQAAPQNVRLAAWLRHHHLMHGISSYWMAASTAVENGGRTTMLSVSIHGAKHRLAPDSWENNQSLDNAKTHTANFIVTTSIEPKTRKLALRMFGKPAKAYHYETYTIWVYRKNLLRLLAPPPRP